MNHLALDLEAALDAAAPEAGGLSGLSRRNAPRELVEAAGIGGLLRMALEEWAMIAMLWAAIALIPNAFYPVAALLLAGRFHALGVVLHDAAHMPLRRKTAAVRVLEALCGYPIATTLNAMRYHHLRHHRDTGMATDPYHKPGSHVAAWRVLQTLRGLALVPFWTVRALVGSVASFTPALRRPYARIFLQDPGREGLENSREVIECAQAEWGQLAFQAAVFVAVASVPGPFLWGYLIPVSIAGMLAARRVLVEHSHEPTLDRRLETILASTNDHSLGLIGALFLAPRNIGFHIVHHLHPQARLGALPALRDWYRGRMGTGYPPAGVRTGSIQGP